MLPEVCESNSLFGYSDLDGLLPGPVPICGVLGDSQAALLGNGCLSRGGAKLTLGTGTSVMVNAGPARPGVSGGIVCSVGWKLNGRLCYVAEGNINHTGALIVWLRDKLRLIENSRDVGPIAAGLEDNGGVYLVPAFTGLGAPHWDQYARGTIVGLTRGCNKYHIIRATLDSLCYQVNDVLHAMEADSGIPMTSLRVDGGASANNYLLQTMADISNVPVLRPRCLETTALGAAYLAGLAVGYWSSPQEVAKNWSVDCTFRPNIPEEQRAKRLRGWNKAVRCAYHWALDEE